MSDYTKASATARRKRVAPHNVSGTKARQGAEYGAGKASRMRPVPVAHPTDTVQTRTGGTATGRQATLTPREKRTALMYGIG
jgi:hypothetical protein